MTEHPEKILIRGVNWIGDAVLTIPAIRAIRKAYPQAHISLLAKPWTAELFRSSHDIDDIILYDDSFSGFMGKFRLAKLLRQKEFDRAILLQNAFDAALITWLARIPERTGYKRDGRGFLLTGAVPVQKDSLGKHQVYYYLDLLNQIGIKTAEIHPFLNVTDDEREWARKTISSVLPGNSLPLIGINPGATYGSAKRWLPERFAELITQIISELQGRVVIFGSEAEVEIADEIISEAGKTTSIDVKSHVRVMSGKTTLRELASLIAECDVFITNDSGPMHMASALYVPTVAIFGSTNRKTTGPFGDEHRIISRDLPCAPCMKRECPEEHVNCMTEVSAGEVFSAIKDLIPLNKAVFLDKDGTIIEDKHYLNSFDELEILPRARGNLLKLKEAGFHLIGVTNQSGIARGIVDEQFTVESNNHLQENLHIDDFFYCPHHPEDKCFCRKPEPLMTLQARLKHRIDFRKSYVIGDKESDVLLAKKVGATGILLSATPLFENSSAAFIAKDLKEAAQWILERDQRVNPEQINREQAQ
jgi:heptosyltransferase-2